MNRLLYANVTRLWKNKIFFTGLGFMFLFGCAYVLKQYQQVKVYGIPVKLEASLFVYANIIGVVSAIFCSLFLGVEYGEGTLRNKIIAGHKRTDIYFSNLIINISASVLLCLSYILPNLILGVPLIGWGDMSLTKALLVFAGSLVAVAALCSGFTMAGLLIQNKAIAPVVCIMGMFLMIGVGLEVSRMLEQPKYYIDTLNPNYLEGEERESYEFLYNFLPAGQEMQYAGRQTENIGEMCLYSAGITMVMTGIGVFFFKRKDIK